MTRRNTGPWPAEAYTLWNEEDFDRHALLPSRRPLRAEHIETTPPHIDEVLRSVWSNLKPRAKANEDALRRNRVLVTILAVIVVLLVALPASRVRKLERAEQARLEAQLPDTARAAVDDVLEQVGHGVEVTTIAFEHSEYAVAWYIDNAKSITFNKSLEWSEPFLTIVAGHECVHALFFQARLSGYNTSLEHKIVEETAAEVLGAHLAGRVFTSTGGNGERVTELLVERFRRLCAKNSPDSARRLYLTYLSREGMEAFHPVDVRLIQSHYGNERLVDEINEICVQFEDPFAAVQEISRKYKLFFKYNPAEIPAA